MQLKFKLSKKATKTSLKKLKGKLCLLNDLVSSILPKNELKNVGFALAYWCRNCSFVFWENLKNPKALSKLTDL